MTDLKTLIHNCSTFLFDMDGTIVNTEPLHAQAAVTILSEMGITIDLVSCLEKYYGMTDMAVLKAECPFLSAEEIDKAIHQKNIALIQIFKNLKPSEKEQYITPGFFSFLNFIKSNKKNVGVVSASEDIIVMETLRCFDIYSHIPLQMGRNQTVKTKPDPEPYLEAMQRLQASPEYTIIFEDSPTGLKAAAASKAKVIRITAHTHNQDPSGFLELKDFMHIL